MKIQIDDVSGLPDALKTLVVTEGETTTLDLTQVASAEELNKFKSKAIKAEGEAIDRRKALEAWKALGETPDAVKALLEAKPKGDPNHDAIVARMKEEHAAELAGRDEKFNALTRKNAQAEVKAELAKAGFVPEALDVFSASAMARIKYDDAGAPQVLTADLSGPMVGNGSNGGATIADLAADLAKASPFAVKADLKGGGGTSQNGQGGKPGAKTVSRAAFDGMSHAERAEFSKGGGKVVD